MRENTCKVLQQTIVHYYHHMVLPAASRAVTAASERVRGLEGAVQEATRQYTGERGMGKRGGMRKERGGEE